MVGPFKKLMTALTSHAYLSLRLESHIFEGEEHLSGVQVALSRGLKFMYARPQAKQQVIEMSDIHRRNHDTA